jgi:hypothetical protein
MYLQFQNIYLAEGMWYSNVLVELFQVENSAYLNKRANLYTTAARALN